MWDAEPFIYMIEREGKSHFPELTIKVEVLECLVRSAGLDLDVGFAVIEVEEVFDDMAIDLAIEGF